MGNLMNEQGIVASVFGLRLIRRYVPLDWYG